MNSSAYDVSENTATNLLKATCSDVLQFGSIVQGNDIAKSSTSRLKEITGFRAVLQNPRFRWQRDPVRKFNTFAQCAETLWILSGRNDVEFLQKYLPRAADFSDDGVTWRAGYGPRLLAWDHPQDCKQDLPPLNQLQEAFLTLQKSPESRQAVVSIWDPFSDGDSKLITKDRACNNHFQFLIRDGGLDMFTTCRSNDVLWGFSGVNLVEFTVIQELMADLLKVRMNEYIQTSNSMHIYERHWELATQVSESKSEFDHFNDTLDSCQLKDWLDIQHVAAGLVNELNTGGYQPFYERDLGYLGIIGDLALAAEAFQYEHPKMAPAIEKIQDPNLVASLTASFIPQNHLAAFAE